MRRDIIVNQVTVNNSIEGGEQTCNRWDIGGVKRRAGDDVDRHNGPESWTGAQESRQQPSTFSYE